jgi:3-hydroxyisobutyrate dehydrogenase
MGAQAAQLYSLFEKLGHGGDDFSALIHLLRGNDEAKAG